MSPCKLFVKDLSASKEISPGKWQLDVLVNNKPMETVPFIYDGSVWIQGLIEQIAGEDKQVLLINDSSGKVKVTNCASVPGDREWIERGVYCSVIGQLTKAAVVPVVAAIKLTNMNSNPAIHSMWPLEIKELKMLLTEQLSPRLN